MNGAFNSREEAFMAGKALAADMIAEALQDEDKSELLAKYRGRGVPQEAFAVKYIRAIQAEPSLEAGFCAALSGAMQAAGSAMYHPDDIRAASYEDCVGGPGTTYMAEEDAGKKQEDTAPQSAVRSPLGALLDRLDHYIDGTEHVCNGNGAGPVLDLIHSGVWGPLLEATEAEDAGDEAGALRRLPLVRAGLAQAFTVCDVNDGRWPLLKVSADLLDQFMLDHLLGQPVITGSKARAPAAETQAV